MTNYYEHRLIEIPSLIRKYEEEINNLKKEQNEILEFLNSKSKSPYLDYSDRRG